jgi:hypothetical protein
MGQNKSTEKMANALVEFKFHRLGEYFFMKPSDCDEIKLCKILYFVRDMGLLV